MISFIRDYPNYHKNPRSLLKDSKENQVLYMKENFAEKYRLYFYD